MVYRTGVRHLSRFLQEVDIFQGLSERHLDRIAALSEESSFKSGQLLGVQNEPGDRLYVLRQGEVIATTGPPDNPLAVRTVRQHETFPLAILFEPPLNVTTARASTDGNALTVPRVRLMELCDLEPHIGAHIYRAACGILVSRYRYALQRLADSVQSATHVSPRWRGTEV